MLETQLWSLSSSCHRLMAEVEELMTQLDPSGEDRMREVTRHLESAAALIQAALDEQRAPASEPGDFLQLTDQILRDDQVVISPTRAEVDINEPPSPDHKQAMHSQSFFLPAAELVTFLCSGRKSGVLRIKTDSELFTIEVADGDIVHAHSDGAPAGERLGDILVERGVLTPQQLAQLLADGSGEPIGQRAIDQQLASKQDLVAALEAQIRRLFQRLFRESPREFVFWEGPCLRAEKTMRLNSTMLLLDGARAADEQSRRPTKA